MKVEIRRKILVSEIKRQPLAFLRGGLKKKLYLPWNNELKNAETEINIS
jgi:hypothetical protein